MIIIDFKGLGFLVYFLVRVALEYLWAFVVDMTMLLPRFINGTTDKWPGVHRVSGDLRNI